MRWVDLSPLSVLFKPWRGMRWSLHNEMHSSINTLLNIDWCWSADLIDMMEDDI